MSVQQQTEIEKLHDTIENLKRENESLNERLNNAIKKKDYGLVWNPIEEAFEKESENKIPILKEIKDKAIVNDDGKPTHILIEGENYHALTCLNYTHKEKIDVIYIDPPYNTGNDGFKYKDKRVLTKFPDGTDVPKESPFRHSYWLSFMTKRLELSYHLLKEDGVIVISIDDNELGQLKLLCDKIFGENNFIGNIIRNTNSTKNQSNFLSITHDYTLFFAKNINFLNQKIINSGSKWEVEKNNVKQYKKYISDLQKKKLSNNEITEELKELTKYPKFVDFVNYWYVDERGVYRKDNIGGVEVGNMNPLWNPITKKNDPIPPGGYRYDDTTLKKMVDEKRIHFHADGSLPTPKRYLDENPKQRPKGIMSDDQRPDYNLFKTMGIQFNNPKQLQFLKRIISIFSRDIIILDFFAGSASTAHATMELNKKDGGNRQWILVTNNENKIMDEVCYPRLQKTIKGYKGIKTQAKYEGLGNSLKYYRASFIGENDISEANDEDIVKLAHHAGELLALAENTLYEIEQNDYYQIFKSEQRFSAIYFREEFNQFEKFVAQVEKLKKPVSIYVFSWGNQNEFEAEFEHIGNARVKSIPQPILEIYQSIYNLIPQQ